MHGYRISKSKLLSQEASIANGVYPLFYSIAGKLGHCQRQNWSRWRLNKFLNSHEFWLKHAVIIRNVFPAAAQ
jgi:hypothetical protein